MIRPLITWYGDDFTGSTDALEALARGGVNAVLYLDQTDDARWLSRFGQVQAIGLAGISRSQSPEWMAEQLPGAFRWLGAFGGRICHYKICSTFDSSPGIGNIGRAIEIGRTVFGGGVVPIIAGAPALQRYTAFGNLFATSGGEVHRIDRHPVMSRHPVTPMLEADLRLHLAAQTSLKIALVSLPEMLSGQAAKRLRQIEQDGGEAALLDVFDDVSLLEAGRVIWTPDGVPPRFVAGSSGVEQSLIAYWRSAGIVPRPYEGNPIAEVDRLVVLSGSCSPVTARQIHQAIRTGYHAVRIDPVQIMTSDIESAKLAQSAAAALSQGHSAVLYTALEGHGGDPLALSGEDRIRFSEQLGNRCGNLLCDVLRQSGLKRAVIAGGDTSSHAGRQLSLRALTFKAPLSAGAPLCAAHADDPLMDGLELVFKGGQIGEDDFFEYARTGRR